MSIASVYFIDIETVPAIQYLPNQNDRTGDLFRKKFHEQISLNDTNEVYDEKAGLYAEFNKIISISVGKLQGTKLYVKTMIGHDEKKLLEDFSVAIASAPILCAHNGKEFDFPILFRRYLINKLPVPAVLNRLNKKTWDPGLEDTMEMWASTQWKYKCSLDLLCHVLGIKSPKEDMAGEDICELYYSTLQENLSEAEKEQLQQIVFKKISQYNAYDVVADVEVYAAIKGVESYTELAFIL